MFLSTPTYIPFVFLGLDYLSVWVKLTAKAMEVPSLRPEIIKHEN